MEDLKKERTFVAVKPDGVQRGMIGEIIKRYERSGLKLIGLKMFVPPVELIEKHYSIDSEWKRKVGEKAINAYKKQGKDHPISDDPLVVGGIVFDKLKKYLTSGPVVAMVWQGMHAVGIIKKITGTTEPLTSDVGTIRGDLTIDSYEVADADGRTVRNLVHCSTSAEEAKNEIPLWFLPQELNDYGLINDAILYGVDLDGILK